MKPFLLLLCYVIAPLAALCFFQMGCRAIYYGFTKPVRPNTDDDSRSTNIFAFGLLGLAAFTVGIGILGLAFEFGPRLPFRFVILG